MKLIVIIKAYLINKTKIFKLLILKKIKKKKLNRYFRLK